MAFRRGGAPPRESPESFVLGTLRQPRSVYWLTAALAVCLLVAGLLLGWGAGLAGAGPLIVEAGGVALLITGAVVIFLMWGEYCRRRGHQDAEEQVRRNLHSYLAETLRGMTGSFFAVDEHWRLTFANSETERLLGGNWSMLSGCPLWDVLPAAWAAVLGTRLRDAMQKRSPLRLELQDTERPECWFELHAYPSGEGLAVYIHDITEHRVLERERQSALERESHARGEAERANAAKDQFLAVLSHELRTPLTPVLLGVSMLENRPDLSAIRHELREIRRNVEMETRLIDDLLDMSRILHGKLLLNLDTVDAHELLRDSVETCRRNDGVVVEMELLASRHHVKADPGRLQQVFWNLLNNAHKFTPAGGRIVVRTRGNEQSNGDEARLVIEVIDSGIGFGPDTAERMFESFEQGPSVVVLQKGGLGLGLSISRALTEAQGGTLRAFSPGDGQGATFTIELPTTAATTEPADRPEPTPAPRGLRLLLVEDHDSTRELMQRLLESMGHQVVAADSVRTALSAAENRDFDLVISDLGLPDGSGHDLMAHLRGRCRAIALSGYGMEDDLRKSGESGFAEHITKPIDVAKLEEAIVRVARG